MAAVFRRVIREQQGVDNIPSAVFHQLPTSVFFTAKSSPLMSGSCLLLNMRSYALNCTHPLTSTPISALPNTNQEFVSVTIENPHGHNQEGGGTSREITQKSIAS